MVVSKIVGFITSICLQSNQQYGKYTYVHGENITKKHENEIGQHKLIVFFFYFYFLFPDTHREYM